MIKINDNISISENYISYKYSRSAGPGGQNVNKVNTKVTLFFNVVNCDSLTDEEKRKIFSRLSTRIGKNGLLRVISQKHRTQKANRNAAIERLAYLLARALRKTLKRKKSSVPYKEKIKRLEDKKKKSHLKKQRKNIPDFND